MIVEHPVPAVLPRIQIVWASLSVHRIDWCTVCETRVNVSMVSMLITLVIYYLRECVSVLRSSVYVSVNQQVHVGLR